MSLSQVLDERGVARTTVVFCVLAALCEGIDLQAAGVAAAGIAAEFKPSPAQLGNFFSASTLGLFLGALIGGRLADRVGRKRILVASIALFGLFSLLTPAAFSMSSLGVARLLTGLGLGGALPNLIALTAESSPAHRRSANVALVYAGAPLGGAIASWISMVSAASHWRWIFIVGGLAPLLLAPIMGWALPESLAFQRARRDSVPRGRVTEVLAAGRASRTLLLWISFFLELLILYLLLNWLPTLLVGVGLTRAEAAGAQIGFNIGGALAALLMGHLLEGRWRNPSIVVTFVALPLLVPLLARTGPQPATVTVLVLLLGCAVLAAQAFLYASAPIPYPTAIRGIGVGAAVAMGRLGSIVGPQLGGLLKGMGHGPSRLFMDLLPIVVAGSLCALWLARRLPKGTELS
jgi:MFS transporter, AAHS family, 3-hydroxyphenylpropionic acid transporter